MRAGETAVVTGAGGGLGVHAVQIARALGARVLAVTSSQEKEAALRELQPDELIVAPDLDFGEIVQALTGDAGADVVMNNLGAVAFEACWASMGQFGRMALVGALTGGAVSLRPAELLFKDARLIGVTGVSRAQLRDVVAMAAAGLVRPVVSRTFPLEGALDAYGLMRTKGSFGRLVLTPGEHSEQPRVGRGGGCPTPPRRPGFLVAGATAMWGEGCGVATAGKLGVFWSARAPLDCSPSVDCRHFFSVVF